MEEALILAALSAAAAAIAVPGLVQRIQLSRAKHPSLSGHARLARRVARWLPYYEYDEETFFNCDGAPAAVTALRRAAFRRLADEFRQRYARTTALTTAAAANIPDLQFTGAYRVPFQFSRYVRTHLKAGAFLRNSRGVTVTDLDGNVFYDLAGSYGVNLFGYDFYKSCIAEGAVRARELGPVLGAYHQAVAYNVERLREISGLDQVSFHMSGTEAVMQAVRLARYHTRRTHVVRFCGAYHGWWGDVQPGVGNPVIARETYTLRDMDEKSLRVLATRRDIACVLVNPLQALHPNAAAPGDSSLIDSTRRAGFDRAAYTSWLEALRKVCTERGIVLVFDEVFLGFRLARGGAQEYFGVRADMVTYGKTVAGGMPIGVVCGRAELMKRFRDERPADICFARGTFNSHPYVMTAMQVFLERLDSREVRDWYADADTRWNARADMLNAQLEAAGLPVEIAHMGSVWTVCYRQPSRYNWMFQYYLRRAGLALSWVGTGRIIFSLNYTDRDFTAVCERFMAAASTMQQDGWWWCDPEVTDQTIKRSVLREIVTNCVRRK